MASSLLLPSAFNNTGFSSSIFEPELKLTSSGDRQSGFKFYSFQEDYYNESPNAPFNQKYGTALLHLNLNF
jgi:hypothetical protein